MQKRNKIPNIKIVKSKTPSSASRKTSALTQTAEEVKNKCFVVECEQGRG